jgi:hypothetical protein
MPYIVATFEVFVSECKKRNICIQNIVYSPKAFIKLYIIIINNYRASAYQHHIRENLKNIHCVNSMELIWTYTKRVVIIV